MLISRYRLFIFAVACSAAATICRPPAADAAFNEQVAVHAKAISMANTVTAYPPGLMSIHYNPAGLCELPEGKTHEQGFTLPWLVKTVKFEADEDFEGFFNTWGPQEGQRHDPVAGTKDSNSSGVMFLPIYDDTVNFMIGPTQGLSSRAPDSRWTFAVGNYAPFAAGMNHKSDSPVAWGGRSIYQQHLIYATPAVGFQMTPTLSVGLSVGAGITALGARVKQRAPNEMTALTRVLGEATEKLYIPIISDLTLPPPWFGGGMGPYDKVATVDFHMRDDFSPNYNLGLLWQPKEWFSYGLVYQSQIETQLTGGYSFRYTEQWQKMVAWNGSSPLTLITAGMLDLPTVGIPYQTGKATAPLTFPQRIQTGIMVKPTKRLRFLFDLHWADWAVTKETRVTFDQKIQLLQLVKLLGYTEGDKDLVLKNDYKNTIDPSIALEYQVNKKLALRCGYGKRYTSVQDHLRDQMSNVMPDLDWFGAGAGINLPNGHKIDIGLGWLTSGKVSIPNNTSDNMNSTDFFKPVYNPYAGLDVEQELDIYLASVAITMPFSDFIEQQKHLMHMQHEAIHKLIGLFKKPFSSSKDDEQAAESTNPDESSH